MRCAVYTLDDPRTGEIRYVGLSVNPDVRLREHVRDAVRHRLKGHRHAWVRSLGVDPDMTVLAWGTREECGWWERELIACLSNLTNHAPGGLGGRPVGIPCSDETKAAISNARRGCAPTSGMTGMKHTPETKERLSESKRQAWADGKFANRRSGWTPERRAQQADVMRRVNQSRASSLT